MQLVGLTTFKLKIEFIWAIEGAVTLSRKMLAGWVRVNALVSRIRLAQNGVGDVFQDEAD
jgi:hypothetical protein